MTTPLIGESFAQCRAWHMDMIDKSREVISVVSSINWEGEYKQIAKEVLDHERDYIKQTWNKLKELQRWFNQSGLKETEPYKEGNLEKNKLLEETPST